MLRRSRSRTLRFSTLALAVLAAVPVLAAPDSTYRYFSRKNLALALAADPDKWVDTSVSVTDELAYVWPANAEFDKEKTGGTACVRFDTFFFRAAIDASKPHEFLDQIWDDARKSVKDIIEKIEAVNEEQRTRKKSEQDADKERRELYWQLHARWKSQPIVTMLAKVARADFITPDYYKSAPNKPDEEAKSRPEPITLLCDRIEKPRERWYLDLDDEP